MAIASVQMATTFEQLLALRSEWHALEAANGAVVPFQTWEWSVAWWNHFREDNPGVRDHLRVCVIRDASDRVLGIAPFILTERPTFGPFRVRYLQLMGADPNVTEIRAMLCLPGCERQCYEAVRECLTSHSDEWDWIAWSGLGRDIGAANTVGAQLAGRQETPAFVLQLPPTWNSLRASLRRNIKESLRKCYNSLKRDGLSSSLETVDGPEAIDSALSDFFRLHTQRARMTHVQRHPDVFESPQTRAFLREVCQLLAQRGAVKVFRLRVQDRVVATRIAFELGQSLYLYYSGWEAAFGKYSVMTTLVCEVIKDAIDRGLTSINLSTGRDLSKTRWSPDEITYLNGTEIAARPSARSLYLGYALVSHPAVKRVARRLMPPVLFRRPGAPRSRPASAAEGVTLLHAASTAVAATAALNLVADEP